MRPRTTQHLGAMWITASAQRFGTDSGDFMLL
jgi:hypothetical protein